MTKLELAREIALREGGFVHHPLDRGGATKYGISQATLCRLLNRQVDSAEIENMTLDTASFILADHYYMEFFDELPTWLCRQLFDISVNSGPHMSVILWQKAINMLGPACIIEDGIYGPKTRAATRLTLDCWSKVSGDALADARISFFCRIVARNSAQAAFLIGWVNRAQLFKSYVET